ncbi:MAG: hypothetical protein ABS922_13795 [Psychrobacillus psychrotolerans]
MKVSKKTNERNFSYYGEVPFSFTGGMDKYSVALLIPHRMGVTKSYK